MSSSAVIPTHGASTMHAHHVNIRCAHGLYSLFMFPLTISSLGVRYHSIPQSWVPWMATTVSNSLPGSNTKPTTSPLIVTTFSLMNMWINSNMKSNAKPKLLTMPRYDLHIQLPVPEFMYCHRLRLRLKEIQPMAQMPPQPAQICGMLLWLILPRACTIALLKQASLFQYVDMVPSGQFWI